MSEQIKYEAVFGPQEMFIGVPEYIELIRFNDYSREYLWGDSNSINHLTFKDLKAIPIVAMRRIIRTPTWTVADQKAGKLPEVGSMLNNKTRGECTFIGFGDDDKTYWALKLKNDLIYIVNKNWCTPIESPEEKAARLEDEFFEQVKLGGMNANTPQKTNSWFELGVRAAYRKHLELAAPKGGE